MKKLTVYILFSLFLISCQNTERSVGFVTGLDGNEYKYCLGTEDAIDVVKKFDSLSATKNYDEYSTIFADSASFTYGSGEKNDLSQFIELNKRRDSILIASNATMKWDLTYAFSVDIAPNIGGEYVNALYNVSYEDGENDGKFNANVWFFVQDGKIINLNQYNQSVIEEETDN